MNFEFATATRIVFGAGAVSQVAGLAKPLGTRALLVAGGNVRRAEKLLSELSAAGLAPVIFQAVGEPNLATVA